MEMLNFDIAFTQNLRCKLVSYYRADQSFFKQNMEGIPAFTNCLLSAIDPVTDRIEYPYFVPQGCVFDMSSFPELFAKPLEFEVIFFDVHSGPIPVFSLAEMKPFMLKNTDQFSPFWTLLRYETINSNFLKDYLVELTLGKMAIFVLRDLNDLSQELFARLRQHFSNDRLYKILNYIHEHIDKDLSLEEMGKMVSLSGDYISQFFKRAIGESIQTYAIDQRVKNGLYLLANTKNSIHDISDKTGFIDQAYFNRRFKKMFGVSPMQVRKSYRSLAKRGTVSSPQNATIAQDSPQ